VPKLIDRIRSGIAGFAAGAVASPAGNVLTVAENDSTFYTGNNLSGHYRDRYDYDRTTILSECLRAWRVNPLARHIVRLTTAFVIGDGIAPSSEHKGTARFLAEWWNHPLNQLPANSKRFMDELTRSGNLFFLCSVLPDGMTIIRAVPAESIKEIQTRDNDVEQETYYILSDLENTTYPAWDWGNPRIATSGEQPYFMVHFSVNRPIGTCWGEPDLAPMLPWIGRFSSWLEDRARLNRFRNTFLWIVSRRWESEQQKAARQSELNARPPAPGSILLADEGETWTAPAPNLNSADAHTDGLDLKKMIAAGAGLPLHYLAEPESSTRTTADAAGTPTFRRLEDIQAEFIAMIESLSTIAVTVRKRTDRRVNAGAPIAISHPDITERDNSLLALAGQRIYPAIAELYDRQAMPQAELTRIFYRMIGEQAPEDLPTTGAKRKPLDAPGSQFPAGDPDEPEEEPAPEAE
jgi:hypothetical protein